MVPRTRLVGVLERIEEIAAAHDLIVMNVFHAGDGNLHPLIAFDRRDAEQVERVHAAGKEIIEAAVAVGGSCPASTASASRSATSCRSPSTRFLVAQACARDAFDPGERLNPDKVLPLGSRCGELVLDAGSLPPGTWL